MTTYYKYQCEYCGHVEAFTSPMEAEEQFTHTQSGVTCNYCAYVENEQMVRKLEQYDAIDVWEEDYYDELLSDEKRNTNN